MGGAQVGFKPCREGRGVGHWEEVKGSRSLKGRYYTVTRDTVDRTQILFNGFKVPLDINK